MTSINPLVDISEKLKQQHLEQQIQRIEADILKLQGAQNMQMFEVEILNDTSVCKVMINPSQIEYVDDNCKGHAVLHMVSGAVLQATKSWADIVADSESPNSKHTYIK